MNRLTRLVATACITTLLLGLAAAQETRIRTAPHGTPVPSGPNGQRIAASKFFVKSTNEKIGLFQQGVFCVGGEDVRFTQKMGAAVLREVGLVVRRELDAAGYPEVRESAFEASAPTKDIEYELGATLVGMQLRACGGGAEVQGAVWVRLDWELYSPRERRANAASSIARYTRAAWTPGRTGR